MHLQTTGYAGNMLLGAGVIPLLIELTKEMKDTPDSLLVANRSVTFLDNFTYSFANASNPFASAGGLGIFVERVHKLVLNGVQLDQSRIDSSAADQDGGKCSNDVEAGQLSLTCKSRLCRHAFLPGIYIAQVPVQMLTAADE
jgi:hypothetical protein